jgi:hypothetical protein
MKKVLLVFPILFLLFISNAHAIVLNENFNFTTEDQAHNGLFLIEQHGNTSCFPNAYNGYYPLWIPNKTAYGVGDIIAFGIAFTNYSNCAPYQYNTIYFYPLDNSFSTTFKVNSGLIDVQARIYLVSNGAYNYALNKTPYLRIRNSNNGFVYNQTNLTQVELAETFTMWKLINVSYNFTDSEDIQIQLVFDDFYNYGGINYWIRFYFDYFKVSGVSCTNSIYCINDFDYKITNSTCGISIKSCSPLICKNFFDYGIENQTSVKGIGCYDVDTEQTSNCYDENNNKIACNKLDPKVSNYGDTTALLIGSIMGIRNLTIAKAFSSLLISLIVPLLIFFVIMSLSKKAKVHTDTLLVIYGIIFLAVLSMFAYINWFDRWIWGGMILLIAIIVFYLTQK